LESSNEKPIVEPLSLAEKDKREEVAKRTIKDSVFSDLFRIKKYLLMLYMVFHPDDTGVKEKDLKDITINNVMTNKLYNDLAFTVNGKLFVLVECQTTWSLNIIIRFLLYLAQEYQEYFIRTKQSLYRSRKVKMPKPELYLIYTGNRGNKPDKISLSKDFFDGEDIGLDIEVKVIYAGKNNNIIDQYITFTRVYDEQRKKLKTTREAVIETIRICKDKGVLKEYLESRESEVISIMMSLFDQGEVLDIYIEDLKNDIEDRKAKDMAKKLLQKNQMSKEDIAEVTGLSMKKINKLEKEIMQLA
jgi:biotin operon repressor